MVPGAGTKVERTTIAFALSRLGEVNDEPRV